MHMIEIVDLPLGTPQFELFLRAPSCINPAAHCAQQRASEAYLLSNQNAFFSHATGRGFVALEGGLPVGRIFASLDDNLAHPNEYRCGHFGFFECLKESQVAHALFHAAEDWLAKQGASAVHGPVNLNIYSGYRVQMTGFDTTAFPGEPRNPDYYPHLMHDAGYQVLSTWSSWDIPNEFIRTSAQARTHIKAKLDMNGYSTRPIQLSRLREEIQFMHECVLETFSQNYGFSTLSLEEFTAAYMPLAPHLSPELFHILLNPQQQPVGFVMGYWDDPTKQERVVFHSVGLNKEYRGADVVYFLAIPFWESAANTSKDAVGGLVKEGPSVFDELGAASRTYSILSKAL